MKNSKKGDEKSINNDIKKHTFTLAMRNKIVNESPSTLALNLHRATEETRVLRPTYLCFYSCSSSY